MKRIMMTTPLVEMDGDEMTRVLWKMIKEKLLLPFVDLKTEYYDLGLVVEGIKPFIPTWTKPITIARHAYGDVYKNTELRVEKGSTAQLRVIDKDWNETCSVVCNKGHDIKKVRSSF